MRKKFFFVLIPLVISLLRPLHLSGLGLESRVEKDLEFENIQFQWAPLDPNQMADVAIIGGGYAGMSLAVSLQKEGVHNVLIFDQAPKGYEGPWRTTARMRTLRSRKNIPEAALGLPSLSFRSWYESRGGDWESLGNIPTLLWADYLEWYRYVLQIPIQNEWKLLSIEPQEDFIRLAFDGNRQIITRKVVLATGMLSVGGESIPKELLEIPKQYWYHSSEVIDPDGLKNKRILVLGGGDSAFDLAAFALDSKAKSVSMVMRRKELPYKNILGLYPYWAHFYYLSDEEKCQFFQTVHKAGVPPPPESIGRLSGYPQFQSYTDCKIQKILFRKEGLHIQMRKELLVVDLILAGTGYQVYLPKDPVMAPFKSKILLWKDLYSNLSSKLGVYPYLGDHFQFLEKKKGCAPYLKNIHCFNTGAYLSHGRISGDIDQLTWGVSRLSKGIAQELQLEKSRLLIRNGL